MCGKELEALTSRPISCGCSNMATIHGDKITATDLSQIILISNPQNSQVPRMSCEDREWQEKRSQRKIRKLDFEIR